MDELVDLELEPTPELGERPPEDDGSGRGPLIVGVVVLLALAAGLGYWWQQRGNDQPTAETADAPAEPTSELPPAVPEPAESAIDLPALNASDDLVRELVQALSTRPELAKWLVTDGVVRRFVVSVDNLAEGRAPTDHLRAMRPEDGFEAHRDGSRWIPSSSSYRRFDGLAAVFDSLDVDGTARLKRDLDPLFEEAYGELGYPGARFDDALARAIRHLLAVPADVARPQLVPKLTSYEYADPELERLSLAQKQLLRMGPENVTRIQEKLRVLAAELGLEVGSS